MDELVISKSVGPWREVPRNLFSSDRLEGVLEGRFWLWVRSELADEKLSPFMIK